MSLFIFLYKIYKFINLSSAKLSDNRNKEKSITFKKGRLFMNIEFKEKEQSGKKRMVALELSEELYQDLRKEAFKREVSLSAIIRYACDLMVLNSEKKGE